MNKITLKLKSLNKKSLHYYKIFLINILNKKSIKVKNFCFPIKKKKITLLKSPHVNKSSREQFEIKTYKSLFIINLSLLQIKYLKFILLNKPQSLTAILKFSKGK